MSAQSSTSSLLNPSLKKALETKKAHIFWFFLINVFFGAMGVWAPLIQPLLAANGTVLPKFIEVLESGGAYTFAVAYLAATAGYIVFEYLDEKEQNFKTAKAVTGGTALVLVVIFGIITATQLAIPSAAPTVKEFGGRELFQTIATIVAVFIGFALAFIQWASSCSLDATVDKNQAESKVESKRVMKRTAGKSGDSSIVQTVGKVKI